MSNNNNTFVLMVTYLYSHTEPTTLTRTAGSLCHVYGYLIGLGISGVDRCLTIIIHLYLWLPTFTGILSQQL